MPQKWEKPPLVQYLTYTHTPLQFAHAVPQRQQSPGATVTYREPLVMVYTQDTQLGARRPPPHTRKSLTVAHREGSHIGKGHHSHSPSPLLFVPQDQSPRSQTHVHSLLPTAVSHPS